MTRLRRPPIRALIVTGTAVAVLGMGSLVVALRAAGHPTPARASASASGSAVATVPPTWTTTTSTMPPSTTTTIDPATARLTARLAAAMAGTTGCLLVTNGTSTLYADDAGAPFAPASTEKLLVAETAISLMGPNFRFVTKVVASAPPQAGRVANLWLVGSGDPLLVTPEFIAFTAGQPRVLGYPYTPIASLADAVAAAGIRSVPGGIHGDDSRYSRLRWLPVWPALYRQEQDIGALSALTVNEGIAQLKPMITLAQDPPATASSELGRLLGSRHVAAAASIDGTAPAGAVVVAQVMSWPLSQIVQAMLRASDNLIAELLVRELDRHAGGTGTTAGGLAVILRQEAALGIPVAAAHLDDGSGLAPTDRASCSLLLSALDQTDRPGLQVVAQGLAVAGRSGTLVHRFVGTPLAGKLAAKTGSIVDVAGMVGFLNVSLPLRFALLLNQPGTSGALATKVDQVVAAIATYPG
jgi:serine-type D-Ala-D-Ala carboxypeptidase/endopeptidase (penicillin-binding protein 4)